MNIILIHYSAPPVVGGVETFLEHQALQLVHAGHTVRILTGRGETWDAHIPVEVLARLDWRYPQLLKTRPALDDGQVPEQFAVLVEQIENDLRRWLLGCDVVIAHNLVTQNRNLPLTAALYNLTRQDGAPRLLLWHHDLAWSADHPAENLHPGWPWDLLRVPWAWARHVTVSEERRQQLAEWFHLPLQDITVIPAGLDLPVFLGLHSRTARLVDTLGLDEAAPILLTPVRITRRKNLDLALNVLEALRSIMPQAVLLITGPAGSQSAANQEYFSYLQELRSALNLRGAAHFLAEIAPDGLPERMLNDLYRLADALFLPSREEGFGFPILEAGLAGIPIFCSDLPALRALAGSSAAYFEPYDDPEQVAALIADHLEASPVYQLKARIRREYTVDAIYRRLLAPLLGAKTTHD